MDRRDGGRQARSDGAEQVRVGSRRLDSDAAQDSGTGVYLELAGEARTETTHLNLPARHGAREVTHL